MRVRLVGALVLGSILIAGCDAFSSGPTYGGLSMAGFNYTPYNLSRFVVIDKYGNKAGGGGDLMPGSGQYPAIRKIIAETKDTPGAFGAAMENLPAPIVKQLQGSKPAIKGGRHG